MAKATDIEIERRIMTVYEMIIKGVSKPFIVRYASEKWGITERQTETYLKRANDITKKTFGKRKRERLILEHQAKLSDLYVKNYKIEDFRECRNLLESERKLLGLDEATKVEQKTDLTINDDELYDSIMSRVRKIKDEK